MTEYKMVYMIRLLKRGREMKEVKATPRMTSITIYY